MYSTSYLLFWTYIICLENASKFSASLERGTDERSNSSLHPTSPQICDGKISYVVMECWNPYVLPVPSTSKIGFHPNLPGPLAGTIFPSVRPTNKIGSVPGPALYAKVHSAYAAFVGKPARRVFKPGDRVDETLATRKTKTATDHLDRVLSESV